MASIFIGEKLGRYGFGKNHPFGTDRMDVFWRQATADGLAKRLNVLAPEDASLIELERFHDPAYLRRAKSICATGFGYLDYGNTPAQLGIFDACRTVVGSGLSALDSIINGDDPRCFIPIAGLHHGRRDGAEGFCVFNDCGVLIETLRLVYKIQRVAYIDIDAHHGDGVFYAYESDADVFIADIHEDGRYLYPGTGFAEECGIGEGQDSKLNLPILPDSNDTDFARLWPRIVERIKDFKPEIILFQAGADSIAGDPITHLKLTPDSHLLATQSLCSLADTYCQGRLLVMGGGGYNRRNIATTWCTVVEALLTS